MPLFKNTSGELQKLSGPRGSCIHIPPRKLVIGRHWYKFSGGVLTQVRRGNPKDVVWEPKSVFDDVQTNAEYLDCLIKLRKLGELPWKPYTFKVAGWLVPGGLSKQEPDQEPVEDVEADSEGVNLVESPEENEPVVVDTDKDSEVVKEDSVEIEKDITDLNYADLRNMAKTLGVKASGKRDALIQRILEARRV